MKENQVRSITVIVLVVRLRGCYVIMKSQLNGEIVCCFTHVEDLNYFREFDLEDHPETLQNDSTDFL